MFSRLKACFLSIAFISIASNAYAQDFPNKPIHLIVPFTAGGVLDTLARTIGAELSKKIGESVVIENKTGASGNIGTSYLARAKPDGYTIGMGTIATHGINPALYKDQLPYDPRADFQPLALVAEQTNIVLVNQEMPVTSIPELIEYAKTSKEGLSYGSAGNGSSQHLAGQLFKLQTNIDLLHIPYRGSVPSLVDLAANRIQLMFVDIPAALPFIQNNSVRPIAVTAKTRSPAFPELPTIAEQGIEDFQVRAWFGVFAPANTPAPIVSFLSENIMEIMQRPDIQDKLKELGIDPKSEGPELFNNYMENELVRWAEIIEQANITL
ncbi:Bug family tripartite tricarboxylate transporter substrate binding protein [Alcaligenes endophyticus]|uniref:Tripartite tricarboxylate transporter substrate binding protein n=1 Tax=Alcaligenes endophyticus TaxID=1929088 RepID=A0ABT8EM70_9BURK|nr:tripartite tricarboxylate transporter substrate binding protein [Alcaligenes endophyticus]MCX5591016.1 tripartite tricarboxylate transporter substrate binding protein [Alcaligenes endophyticus]MDN4122407.1 tripartite tricarboxylate transporter substrate binding protein [Alcaligenes endophyticus]